MLVINESKVNNKWNFSATAEFRTGSLPNIIPQCYHYNNLQSSILQDTSMLVPTENACSSAELARALEVKVPLISVLHKENMKKAPNRKNSFIHIRKQDKTRNVRVTLH
jgi:hypothetical protein